MTWHLPWHEIHVDIEAIHCQPPAWHYIYPDMRYIWTQKLSTVNLPQYMTWYLTWHETQKLSTVNLPYDMTSTLTWDTCRHRSYPLSACLITEEAINVWNPLACPTREGGLTCIQHTCCVRGDRHFRSDPRPNQQRWSVSPPLGGGFNNSIKCHNNTSVVGAKRLQLTFSCRPQQPLLWNVLMGENPIS